MPALWLSIQLTHEGADDLRTEQAEFAASCNPGMWVLRTCMIIFGSFTCMSTIVYLRREDGAMGGRQWALIQWSGYGICVLVSAVCIRACAESVCVHACAESVCVHACAWVCAWSI